MCIYYATLYFSDVRKHGSKERKLCLRKRWINYCKLYLEYISSFKPRIHQQDFKKKSLYVVLVPKLSRRISDNFFIHLNRNSCEFFMIFTGKNHVNYTFSAQFTWKFSREIHMRRFCLCKLPSRNVKQSTSPCLSPCLINSIYYGSKYQTSSKNYVYIALTLLTSSAKGYNPRKFVNNLYLHLEKWIVLNVCVVWFFPVCVLFCSEDRFRRTLNYNRKLMIFRFLFKTDRTPIHVCHEEADPNIVGGSEMLGEFIVRTSRTD